MASIQHAELEINEALAGEVMRLRGEIQRAIDYANGRESEWGERAEGAFAILYAALQPVGQCQLCAGSGLLEVVPGQVHACDCKRALSRANTKTCRDCGATNHE